MSINWPNITTPTITDNVTTLNSAGLGAITDALVTRTDQLKALIGEQHENAIIVNDSGMAGLVSGDVVYFNAAHSCYEKAQPISTDADAIVPSPSAYIAGIVYDNPTADGQGKLLVSGVVSAAAIGLSNKPAGAYYLGDNGTLVLGAQIGRLAIYCGYLTTTKWFIFNPASPSPKVTDQTIAAPIENIIEGDGIAVSSATGTRTVEISANLTSGAVLTSGGIAVATVSGGQLVTTPVINSFSNNGLGIQATVTDGVATLRATGLSDYLDLQTINANNVLIGGAVNDALITFPAGIASSVVGLVRLPHALPSNGIRLFVWTTGSTSGLSASFTPIRGGQSQTTVSWLNFSHDASAPAAEFWTPLQQNVAGDDLLRIVFSVSDATTPVSIQALGVIL